MKIKLDNLHRTFGELDRRLRTLSDDDVKRLLRKYTDTLIPGIKNKADNCRPYWFGGVTEIRTRETLLTFTRFPGVPLQPLEHHSL